MIPYEEITIEKAKPKFNSSPIITLEAIEMNQNQHQNTTFKFPDGRKGD
jgi:hypothetical protein